MTESATAAPSMAIDEHRGLLVVEHGGALGGYRTSLVRFPDERYSVVVLANLSSAQPSELAMQVADIYLADRYTEPEDEREENGGEVELPKAGAEPIADVPDHPPLVLSVDVEGNLFINVGDDEDEPASSKDVVARVGAVLRNRPDTPILVKADRAVPYGNVVGAFERWWIAAIYIFVMLLLSGHLIHGVWSMFKTAGISHPQYDGWIWAFAIVMTILIVVGFASVPVAVLLGLVHL